eukprot:4513378-Pyramimonas_sp.AAC.1
MDAGRFMRTPTAGDICHPSRAVQARARDEGLRHDGNFRDPPNSARTDWAAKAEPKTSNKSKRTQ